MTVLTIERILPASLETVFRMVTDRKHLLEWWGPEGMGVAEEALDFSRPGPWFSVMQNADGHRYKVSGHVTKVAAPNLVAFTWGWHDESDRRGPESHVQIELEVVEDGAKTRLTLRHVDLPDAEARDNHEAGWTSSLRKFEAQFS